MVILCMKVEGKDLAELRSLWVKTVNKYDLKRFTVSSTIFHFANRQSITPNKRQAVDQTKQNVRDWLNKWICMYSKLDVIDPNILSPRHFIIIIHNYRNIFRRFTAYVLKLFLTDQVSDPINYKKSTHKAIFKCNVLQRNTQFEVTKSWSEKKL